VRGLDRVLPIVSMAAICIIITIITSLSRDKLLSIALSLIAVVALHNLAGVSLRLLERARVRHGGSGRADGGHRSGPAERRHGVRAGHQRAAQLRCRAGLPRSSGRG
jgi:hypothetical protein